ncbi:MULTISPECIES: TrkA family potassium uptake protein [unclassified Aureispira]|uniref:potassium channel family protein n=1 Tax=unclassified Aureispira TaxID=2649989 RepID=UPI0006985C16|nr:MULTISPECIES: potassium channel protein [unclassified Aureispira]WMX12499.1 potassium channel protein [Aureispira sp. CCB-E]
MLPGSYHKNSVRIQRFQRVNKYIRNILLAIVLLCTTTVTGIVGFMTIDHYTFSEAFYMTIITLSTVGFGEVQPLSPNGQVFTSFLIIFNLGVFAYAISIISNFILEGELRVFLKDYKMYQKIQKLEDHTIVCGFGRHGRQICKELTKNNLPFVVIEPEGKQFEDLRELKYLFMEGDATDDEILIDAGIHNAKAVVVTYNENALNVYTVLTARQLNPKLRIITRATDRTAEKKLLRAGANHVVLTEVIGGFYMATLIHQPNVVEFFSIISNMGDVSIHFKEVHYDELKKEYRDKSILDLSLRSHTGVNIIGVRRVGGQYDVNPKPDIIIKKGMTLVVLGDLNQIKLFQDRIMMNQPPSEDQNTHSRY